MDIQQRLAEHPFNGLKPNHCQATGRRRDAPRPEAERGRVNYTTGPRQKWGEYPATRELYDAMRAVAKTDHGPTAQIAFMGCSIKWKTPA
jgi:hypothetical protein